MRSSSCLGTSPRLDASPSSSRTVLFIVTVYSFIFVKTFKLRRKRTEKVKSKMAGWIVIPSKRTEAVDFKKPLEKFIKNTFSEEVLNENSDAIAELNKLRNTAVMQVPDKHESASQPLLRYTHKDNIKSY